jgi:hypothetical protein
MKQEHTPLWEDAEKQAAQKYGATPNTARVVEEADDLHYAIYATQMGQCAIAEYMRSIALATYTDRRKHYLYEIHKLNRAHLIHLALWGPEPCPEYPGPGRFPDE